MLRFVLLPALLLVLLASVDAAAAPQDKPWSRWERHDPRSIAVIDHSAWDRWLARYVIRDLNGVNRVAYAAVGEEGRRELDRYIDRLAAVAISCYRRDEQLAYWINLYNALTVRVVLHHYPVGSIRDIRISPGLFAVGPWGAKLVTVEGERLSLDDIEHRILRPIWRDPRLHYAVNCAFVGCPDLQREAYSGAHVEGQLDAAARNYVNSWRGASFEDDGLYVSSLYKWYAADFGGSEAGVLAHLRRYATGDTAARLAHTSHIAGYRYDWDLNDATARGK